MREDGPFIPPPLSSHGQPRGNYIYVRPGGFMKAVLVLALGFVTATASADSLTVVCDGKSRVKSGKVEITVAGDLFQPSPNYYFYDAGYTYNVHWQDSSRALKSASMTCGVTSAQAECSLQASGPNVPFSIYEACDVGAFDTRGVPHETFSSRLTISKDHGSFYCAARTVAPVVIQNIQLSNCKSKK